MPILLYGTFYDTDKQLLDILNAAVNYLNVDMKRERVANTARCFLYILC